MPYNPAPFSVSALNAEIANDPAQLGYNSAANQGSDAAKAALINAVRSDYQVPVEPISSSSFVAALNGTESQNFSVTIWAAIQTYAPGGGTVEIGKANVQTWIDNTFANYPNTLANLQGKFTRNGSRAEWLWGSAYLGGHGPVSDEDIAQAFGRG